MLLCALNAGRVGTAWDGTDIAVDGSRDLARVGHNDLIRLFFGQIAELFQHVLGGAVEQRRLVVGILEAIARLKDRAVDGVFRLGEMDVAGGDDRLVQVFAQLDDRAVEILDDLLAVHLALADHIGVVAQRLDLQHIVIGRDLLQFLVRASLHDGAVKFTCFTGGGQDEAVAVLVQQAAGHTGLFEEVVDMGLADDLVQIFQAHLVLDQNDEVVVFLLQHLTVAAQAGVDVADSRDLLFFQILQHHAENAAQRPSILAGAVGLVGRQFQMLVDGALLVVVQGRGTWPAPWSGCRYRSVQTRCRSVGRDAEEADVKRVGVVGHQNASACKIQERLQCLSLTGGIGDHLVGDTGQLGDLGCDGLAGFDEGVKFLHDFAVFHDDAADLGQVLHVGVQSVVSVSNTQNSPVRGASCTP